MLQDLIKEYAKAKKEGNLKKAQHIQRTAYSRLGMDAYTLDVLAKEIGDEDK
jgi:hypothetical protein